MGASAYSLAKLREALAAEGISDASLDTRLDTLEANTLDSRIDALEALGIGTRLDDLEADGGGASAAIPQAKLTKSANQAMTGDNSYRKVTFDGAAYDRNHGGTPHFNDADDQLVCRVAGLYVVAYHFSFTNFGGTAYFAGVQVQLNGASVNDLLDQDTHVSGLAPHLPRAGLVALAVDDELDLWAKHNQTGTSRDVGTSTTLAFARIGDGG